MIRIALEFTSWPDLSMLSMTGDVLHGFFPPPPEQDTKMNARATFKKRLMTDC